MKKGSVLNEVFDRLKVAIDVVEELVDGGYSMSSDFGVVTSCPTNKLSSNLDRALSSPLSARAPTFADNIT